MYHSNKKVVRGQLLPHLPADVFIPDFAHGHDLVADVAVIDPLQPLYLNDTLAGQSAAELYAENVKNARYKKEVEQNGHIFTPLVVETSGGWTDKSHQTLDTIAKRWAHRLETNVIKVRANMYQRLSATLQRSCSAMVLTRLPKDPWTCVENF